MRRSWVLTSEVLEDAGDIDDVGRVAGGPVVHLDRLAGGGVAYAVEEAVDR